MKPTETEENPVEKTVLRRVSDVSAIALKCCVTLLPV